MKLLTFLGTGNYYETTYVWREQEFTTKYAPVASIYFLKPDELLVFLTDEAEEQVFPGFQKALKSLPKVPVVKPRPIPLGKDEKELWDLFSIIAGSVKAKESVVFDITHGLRSFPYLSLLVASFLRAGFAVDVQAVLYGAFDVRDQSVTPNRAPMFDLSPMLGLLEWATATDRFNRTGDARYLASLLKKQQSALAKKWADQPESLRSLSALGNLKGALEAISQSLRLIRPHESMESITRLSEYVEKARPVLEQAPGAQPFVSLLQKINETYMSLSLPETTSNPWPVYTLEKERKMLQWYAEREQWVQAVALGREWLVSWVMGYLHLSPETSSTERRRVEGFINLEAEAFVQCKKEKREFMPVFLHDLPKVETVLGLWKAFTDTRNDILHAGMRDKPETPKNLIGNIQKAIDTILQLPLPE